MRVDGPPRREVCGDYKSQSQSPPHVVGELGRYGCRRQSLFLVREILPSDKLIIFTWTDFV